MLHLQQLESITKQELTKLVKSLKPNKNLITDILIFLIIESVLCIALIVLKVILHWFNILL